MLLLLLIEIKINILNKINARVNVACPSLNLLNDYHCILI